MKFSSICFSLFAFAILIASIGCEELIESGCTDSKALNHDFIAEKDDGSCYYSRVTFYSKWGSFNGINIAKVDVSVDGNFMGTITKVFPNGPGNCSSQGNVAYEFNSGERVDWNATITLVNGASLVSGGTVSPSRSSECLKVNVAR